MTDRLVILAAQLTSAVESFPLTPAEVFTVFQIASGGTRLSLSKEEADACTVRAAQLLVEACRTQPVPVAWYHAKNPDRPSPVFCIDYDDERVRLAVAHDGPVTIELTREEFAEQYERRKG